MQGVVRGLAWLQAACRDQAGRRRAAWRAQSLGVMGSNDSGEGGSLRGAERRRAEKRLEEAAGFCAEARKAGGGLSGLVEAEASEGNWPLLWADVVRKGSRVRG
ncbi:uncharacterized protein A4U43_C04F24990 [Asparagus officinalis]|uniref:Uncharacterized protein n=1 Tax=Asparagus officinalis TaxID=4686 RepID=A0A5P1F3I8_ASPOF|nr:uncharacterized protein A4U43_C04F24990 [Asparagus officinalis]